VPSESYLQDPKLAATLADELTGYGGGIDFRGGNNLDIVNSTITDNHAIKGGGGLNSAKSYAAVSLDTSIGITLLLNTIIAGNTSTAGGGDCNVEDNIIIQSEGHNLASDGSCFLTASGDLPNRNPLLAPLAYNGGPTETQALLPGSPAIGAGATQGCPQTDQRGVARPQGGCDIGAYQYVAPATKSARRRTKHHRERRARRRRTHSRTRHERHARSAGAGAGAGAGAKNRRRHSHS
jgi:hypothetical protein